MAIAAPLQLQTFSLQHTYCIVYLVKRATQIPLKPQISDRPPLQKQARIQWKMNGNSKETSKKQILRKDTDLCRSVRIRLLRMAIKVLDETDLELLQQL